MIFPYFLLDFKNKKEYILCHYFRIAPFRYIPNKTIHFEEILTSDKFKTRKEYYSYLSDNHISNIETRYSQDTHNLNNPIGTLLFDFLDADLSNTTFIKKCALKYGASAVHTVTEGWDDFETEINRYNNNESQYESSYEIELFDEVLDIQSNVKLEEYQELQAELKKAINFVYNLNNLPYLKDLSASQRFFIYNIKQSSKEKNMYSYLEQIGISYSLDFSKYTNSIESYINLNSEEIAKELKKKSRNQHLTKTFSYSFPCLLSAYYFSLIYFVENNIPIKRCKNCGKYFIPENRNSSVYCNRIYTDKKTCKEIGANNAYNEKLKKDEVNKLYRRTLSAKKMLANRNPDIPIYLEKYEKWKIEANKFRQDIKEGKKTEEEFKKWLEKTKKK